MSSPLDITVEEAHEIVLIESRKKGWVRPELYHSENAESREILESLRGIREDFGDTVDIIARGIYSRRGRFILELIQNVEDSNFNHTNNPFIAFEVNPQKIIVESNQDGFSAEDVKQICHTGNSWKRGRAGYVGEKGIGFKSVFKVASRVDIQSNAFCFFFQYNGGATSEEKLGIVTPTPGNDPIPPSGRPLTRMTLTLSTTIVYQDLVSDFSAIPETLLLFLTKIKELRVKIHHPDQGRTTTYAFRKSQDADGTTCISKSEEESIFSDEWRFRVARAPVDGLPDDPDRHNINECEGVAFPVDALGSPRRQTGYDVYAFLPVCTVGFNFVLQADFLLQASRQEVIVDSLWNVAIIDHIAEVFCNAMVGFCANPSLRFRWTEFLPIGRTFEMNPLWQNLSAKVIQLLAQQRVLYPHDPTQVYANGTLFQPSFLRTLPSECLDVDGSPLFADRPGVNRRYLSLRYSQPNIRTLRRAFQLHDIEDIHMFHRIQQDLGSPASTMKSPDTSFDWHTRAADLIVSIIVRSPEVGNMIMDQLDLIPLSEGRWVTATMTDLHFPSTSGPAMPSDVVITVHQDPAGNIARRRMLEALGVTQIHPHEVIGRLWSLYTQEGGAFNLNASKIHLRYLYWYHMSINDPQYSRLWIYDSRMTKITCRRDLIYMPSNDEYGPSELLKSVPDPEDPRRMVPECMVSYAHADYMDSYTSGTRRQHISWLGWLETGLGVRRIPRMKYDAGSLSPEFRHILWYRPNKAVGLLKLDWGVYKRDITNRIEQEISQAKVTCQNDSRTVMSSTYFPSHGLSQIALRLQFPRSFPFLAIPGLDRDERGFEDWRFLERFGVKFEANLAFFLEALTHHESQNPSIWNGDIRQGIMSTYEWIADHCNEISREIVKEEFDRSNLILHPQAFRLDSEGPTWLDSRSCLWRGPENNLLDKTCLASVASYRNNRKVQLLFCQILGIRNANWCDYRDELVKLRNSQLSAPEISNKVSRLYQLLSSDRTMTDQDWGSLLNTFENNRLVYIASGPSWFAPSQCLWTSPVPVPGKAILDVLYPELRTFFQDRLRISRAVLSTLIEGLCSLANGRPSLLEIKQMIRAINDMDPRVDDLNPLLSCNILPIRNVSHGVVSTTFQSCTSNFVINDRVKLATIFTEFVGFLDYSLEEVRALTPFLHALNLSEKYLSSVCTEQTFSNDNGALDLDLTEKFKDRAYHLLRPLANSSPQPLYNKLLATSVSKSDSLRIQFIIRHRSGDAVGPINGGSGHVHIQDEGADGGWRILVPMNRDAREVCYQRQLPHALAKLFRIDDATCESIIQILNSSLAVIDELLEQGGIGKVPGIEPPPRRVIVEDANQHRVSINGESAPAEEIERDSQLPMTPSTPSSSHFGEIGGRISPPRAPLRARSPSLAYPEGHEDLPYKAYIELLTNVIRIAGITTLPRRNQQPGADGGQFHEDFDHDAAFGVRSQGQMNHDVKIGAAGELFVYELLRNLGLLSFGWENWTSTIRKEVLIHPDYRNYTPWPGRRETSDLRYQDNESILTEHLINAGYLDGDVWRGANPEYFIEVKTSTGNLSDRFFISSNQYHLMQRMALVPGQVTPRIYVIFRVYHLGRDSLSVQIYVNPEAHRGESLIFTVHTWTVAPSS